MRPIALFIALAAAPSLFAHDTWIAPDRFTGDCGAVTLHMTSGMEFAKLDSAIDPARVTRAIAMIPGRRLNLTPTPAAHSLDFQVDVPNGISMFAVELAPKTLDLTPKQVAEYLDEIAARDDVRAAWKAHPGRWRETYTKHAKTILRCGETRDSFQRTAEMGLEIIPQVTNPTTLKAGDTLKVIVVPKGKTPLLDQPIVLVREGGARVATVKTDKYGFAAFTVKEPGRYMLSTTTLQPADGKDADWTSDFSTLTFDVE